MDNGILKLQNGSDIRGVAIEGVAGENVNLTPERVNCIAAAFGDFLAKRTGKKSADLKVGVGRDSRITGEVLKLQVIMGLTESGCAVYDCGLASTPSMFMGCIYEESDFDGAVMITASHLPYNRNGMKFFSKEGGLEKSDIAEILRAASEKTNVYGNLSLRRPFDLLSLYAEKLCDKMRCAIKAADYERPLSGMKIIVDAGNGAGGFFAEKILKPLGADTSGSLFLEPDGYFPNHMPNPENKQAMQCLSSAVLKEKAELGLIFDTDVDRMSAVLSDGEFVNRDALIAMMAAIAAIDVPEGVIITDSVTADELTDFLEDKLKLKHHRFMRGYKNVINECKRLNKEAGKIVSPLAIETSGHGAMAENYYLDDGAYLAVKLLIAAARLNGEGRNLKSLIAEMKPMHRQSENRYKIIDQAAKEYGKDALKTLKERALKDGSIYVVEPSYEGVRLAFHGAIEGWALVRVSLHDPEMVLNIQENRDGDLKAIQEKMDKLLAGFHISR
jgi:phosphomannomutase